MKLIFSIFILFASFMYVTSECCGAYTIRYSLKEGYTQCNESIPGGEQKTAVDNDGVVNDIFSKLDRRRPRCWIAVCYDGRNHPGSYCGHMSCDIFGCSCGGGCINGEGEHPQDPYQNFMDRYGNYVSRARLNAEWENFLP
uniref:Setae polypeptide n=1 Tax=Ochrogaster lunifer TaxID=319761 RepID=A0AA49ESF7_OCHLU|nr:setae polypeptide [Ochrogaster lunifer]